MEDAAMLDLTTAKGAIIAAALRLAAERPWSQVTLADIAEAAGVSLVRLKGEFASKGELLAAFTALVDDEVLSRVARRTPDQAARDALFEVIMSRFDVLMPYKAALRSIADAGSLEPAQIGPILNSQRWMLEAAGIGTGGLEGGLRIAGLTSVYASVFRTWLGDDDPGHARTMAALDRRLRRGERTLARIEGFCSSLSRLVSAAMPRGFERPTSRDGDAGGPTPSPSPGAGPHPGASV
jgi:AcrR family transcriptional regulator